MIKCTTGIQPFNKLERLVQVSGFSAQSARYNAMTGTDIFREGILSRNIRHRSDLSGRRFQHCQQADFTAFDVAASAFRNRCWWRY